MQSITAQKKIDAIVDNVNKKGIIAETMIKELKELREMAQLEKDPLIVKTLRLVYSYIEDEGSFDLNLLEEEEVDEIEDLDEEENKVIGEEEAEEEEEESYDFSTVEDFEEKRENFLYFLGLIKESENEYNRKRIEKTSFFPMGKDPWIRINYFKNPDLISRDFFTNFHYLSS